MASFNFGTVYFNCLVFMKNSCCVSEHKLMSKCLFNVSFPIDVDEDHSFDPELLLGLTAFSAH